MLLEGNASPATYCALLRNLYAIYTALERALAARAAHPCVAPLLLPGLERRPALIVDLETLHGPGWSDMLSPEPSCDRYVRRLAHLAEERAELLAAHAYVRYMGDLNGGQILARAVAKSWGADKRDGLSFYCFDAPGGAPALSQGFRAALDALPVTDGQAADSEREARLAFDFNIALFEELAARNLPNRQTAS
jgi:heme oxygenase